MNIQKISINNLIEADYNPRKNLQPDDEEYKKIKKSIEKFGYVEPVIVNTKDKILKIISGHQRIKVLKDLGYKEINCVLVNLNDSDEKTLNVALNKISGEWDNEKLQAVLKELKDFDQDQFFLTGFNDNEFQKLEMEFSQNQSINKSASNDNFNESEAKEEAEKNLITKPGYFYQLGNHHLLCGDSFKADDRNKLINNKLFDMLFTDPPYSFGNGSLKRSKKRLEKLINLDTKQLSFLPDLDIKSYYIFCSKDSIKDLLNIYPDDYIYDVLAWCKTNPTPLTNNKFLPDVEYLLYFAIRKERIWNNSLKPNEIYKKYFTSKKEEGKKDDGDLHPTMKPIELISNRLRISSNENSNILDLFAGSGSTMIAADQLKRNCYMMEIEPIFCDVIIRRYIKFKSGKSDDVFLIDKNNKKIPWSQLVGGN